MLRATQYQRLGKLWFLHADLDAFIENRKQVSVTSANAVEAEREVSVEEQEAFLSALGRMAARGSEIAVDGDGFNYEE